MSLAGAKKKLWTVSPSQVEAYRRCPRVWYNQSVLGDREPSKPFQSRGDAIHKALEVYMLSGEVLPAVKPESAPDTEVKTLEYVQVAIEHLPPPANDNHWKQWPEGQAGPMLEQSGEMATYEGGPGFVQYIDQIEAYPDRAKITDYKTTSNFRYAKTPAELATNTQLCANARWLFSVSDYEKVDVGHLYLLTTGRPKAMPVYTTVTRESVEQVWQRDMALVREMVAWAEMGPPTADPLPPNTNSCDMYGGCYYRTKCGLDPAATRSPFKMEMDGPKKSRVLDDMLKALQKDSPNAGTIKPHTPTEEFEKSFKPAAPEAAPAAPKPTGLAALLGGSAPAPTPPAPPPPPAPPEPALTPETAAAAAVAAGYPEEFTPPAGLVPPDAPSPVSTPEEIAAANPPEETKEEAPAAAAAPTEKKKGRPPGSGKKKDAAPAAVAPVAPVAPATPAPAAPVESAPVVETQAAGFTQAKNDISVPTPVGDDLVAERARDILRTPDAAFVCGCEALFIDCLPAKGWPGEAPVDLNELMHAFQTTAAASAKKLDYRLISYESKGYLALAIKVLMKGLPKSVYVDSRTPGADVFLAEVIPYAKMVVRGTR